MPLANLSVRKKIAAIDLTVGAALVILLLTTVFFFGELNQGLGRVRDDSVPNAMLAKDMQLQVVQIQQWLTDISATRALDGLDDGFKQAEKAHTAFLADLDQLRASYERTGNAKGIAEVDEVRKRLAAWYAAGKAMAQAYIDSGTSAGNKMMGEFDKVSTELQETMEPLIEAQLEATRRDVDSGVTQARKVQMVLVGGICLVVLGLAFGGTLVAHGIAKPLEHVSSSMSEVVKAGNFSVSIDTVGDDEIAHTGRSFNDLVGMLRAMLLDLKHDVRQLDETAMTLAAAVDKSSSSSSKASESAAAIAASVEQMSVSLSQMRDNTQSALVTVADATRYSVDGGRVIGDAIAAMQRIAGAVQEVATVIGKLGAQTAEISNIVKVIREVADQTNLLALNAAIEAARAGEQGRGFAVVADEVRTLAERTTKATGDIAAMITAIQASAGAAVDQMDKAVTEAKGGARLADNAGQAIAAIRDSTDQVAAAFREISGAITEQSSAGEDIAQRVEQVARAAEENSGAVANTTEAARTLKALSSDIRGRIEQFRT